MMGFIEGDRVLVRCELAHGFIQPYRNWVAEARMATVRFVRDGDVGVRFDCRRPPKRPTDYDAVFRADDLVHASMPA